MILCDTNILIEFYKNNPSIVEALQQIGRSNIAVSVVTQAELYFGAFNKRELGALRKHLSTITSLPINESVSGRFIMLMETYSLSHKLAIPDALIAATAIEYNLPIYTLNLRDFRFIESLQLYSVV